MSFEALVGAAAQNVGRASVSLMRQYLLHKPGVTQLVEDGWELRTDGYWFYWRHEKDRMGRERVREWGHGKEEKATCFCREYWKDEQSGRFFLIPRLSQVPSLEWWFGTNPPPVYPEIEKLEKQGWVINGSDDIQHSKEGAVGYVKVGQTSFGAEVMHLWTGPEVLCGPKAKVFSCALKDSSGDWQVVYAIKGEKVTFPAEF